MRWRAFLADISLYPSKTETTVLETITERDVVRRYEQALAELKAARYGNFHFEQVSDDTWVIASTAAYWFPSRDVIEGATRKFQPLFATYNSWKTVLEKVRAGTPVIIAVLEREY